MFKYLNLFNKTSVLFVCTGNLCRSPTAQAVFLYLAEQSGLSRHLRIASAGTHVGRSGDPADARAIRAAARRGYDMRPMRTRPLRLADFKRFDYVLAMDMKNMAQLVHDCPPEHAGKLALFMRYGAAAEADSIPDPYFGPAKGFERVLDMVEDAAQGLLRHIRQQRSL